MIFTTSLLNPFLRKVTERLNPWTCYGLLTVILLVNDGLYKGVFERLPGPMDKVMIYLFTFTVGYAGISGFGMLFTRLNHKQKWIFAAVSAVLLTAFGLYYRFAELQPFKHPPMLYYISYGLMWSAVLYGIFLPIRKKLSSWKMIQWLSLNSMTIYLFHIFWFYLLQYLQMEERVSSVLIYLIIVLCSAGSTFIYLLIKKKVRGAA